MLLEVSHCLCEYHQDNGSEMVITIYGVMECKKIIVPRFSSLEGVTHQTVNLDRPTMP